jgi:hypothetical protein
MRERVWLKPLNHYPLILSPSKDESDEEQEKPPAIFMGSGSPFRCGRDDNRRGGALDAYSNLTP